MEISGNGWTSLDGMNEVILQVVESMDTDVIVERASCECQPVVRNSRGVPPVAQKIDLYQVNLALQDFSLLAEVQIATVFARCLIGEAKHLDGGHQPRFGTATDIDLHQRFDAR